MGKKINESGLHNRNGLSSAFDKVKDVLLFFLKIFARIPYLCVAVIPFLNRFIPSNVVLWMWIPALVVSLIIDVFLYIRQSKNPPKKKKRKKIDDFTRGSSILAVVIFLSVLIINYFDTPYNWGIAIPLIFCVLISLFINGPFDYIIKKRQEKQSVVIDFTKVKIQYIMFYCLVAVFSISIYTKWEVGGFVFGGIALLILLYSVASSFLSQKIKYKWMLIHDFVAAVALTVYLIYSIPNATIQNVVLVLVSSIYGGFIALVGVAWTIKDGQKREAEAKRLEKIPYLQVEIDKRSTCDGNGGNTPFMCIDITPTNGDDSITSGERIKITNIGLGMVNNMQCYADSAAGKSKLSLPTTLLRCDAYCYSNVLFNAGRQENTSVNGLKLLFLFDDLLGNHYEQCLQMIIEINPGYIKVLSYKMDVPVFVGRDNYT